MSRTRPVKRLARLLATGHGAAAAVAFPGTAAAAAAHSAVAAARPTAAVPAFYYNDVYTVVMPGTSSFPMEKYRYVREALQREFEGNGKATFHESPLATFDDLTTVHAADYVTRYLNNELSRLENRRIGFPWSEAHRDRALSSVGGTVAAMHTVLRPGVGGAEGPRFAGHIAGGTHHAFRERGEGYCVFNDIAVAAACALRDYPDVVRRVLLIDLDVHQGNGSARIFASDPRVHTYSQVSLRAGTGYRLTHAQAAASSVHRPPPPRGTGHRFPQA